MITEPGAAAGMDTLATSIAASMRTSIMCGELRPNSRLRLDTLRKQFKVSYSPLREALSRLGVLGLVSIVDQRGYRVAPVSRRSLEHVIRLRKELEAMALRESIAQGDTSWVAGLVDSHRLLSEMSADARANDTEAWEERHRRFHFALLQGCDMPLLMQFISILHDQTDRYRRLFLRTHSHDRDVPGEHSAILRATLGREADVAVALLQQHIARTGQNVLTAIGSISDEHLLNEPEQPSRP
jgi:DNA-binding GntR family transcriptional regulator